MQTDPTVEPAEPPPSPAHRKKPKTPPEIRLKVSWCKSCGLCVDYCNRGVLEMKNGLPNVVNADRCSRCLQCEAICPDFAIEVGEADAKDVPDGDR